MVAVFGDNRDCILPQVVWHIPLFDDGGMLSERAGAMSKHLGLAGRYDARQRPLHARFLGGLITPSPEIPRRRAFALARNDKWLSIEEGITQSASQVRQHDAHGQQYMDILDTSGREREKVWLDCTNNEAVTPVQRDQLGRRTSA